MLRSNFLELTPAMRTIKCGDDSLLVATERYWYSEPTPFEVCRDEKWWEAPDGFHHEPEQLGEPQLRAGVLLLEGIATTLANAAYPARRQPLRVADSALLFLVEPKSIAALRTLLLIEGCLTASECPLTSIVEARQKTHGEAFPSAVNNAIRALSDPDVHCGPASLRIEMNDWLLTEFPGWVTTFTLELMRWKSSPNLEAVGDADHE